jgi:spermidine/putrescine transport system ATP-binding protein
MARNSGTGFRDARGDLRLEDVTKAFGDFTAVDDLSLVVPRGSFFALLGPSGCGKTTTLRMVAGLEQPTRGRVLIGDTDLTGSRPYERPVNTVFQSYALFPHLTIRDNVAFGPKRRGESDAGAHADEALALVQMDHLAGRKPAQLSGGQQQRVALARALVNRPEVLLLDEPLGALDLKLRRQMQVELKRIQTEVGLTFIHVTHDQEEAMTMADTVAVMNHGRIEQMGPPEELYDLPRTAFVANFVGQSNLGSGRVVDRDGSHLVAEVQGTKVKIPLARTAVSDGHVTFGVRPEKVRVMRKPPEGVGDDVKGVVLDVSFTGVATQYLVRLPSGAVWSCYEQNLDVEPIDVRPGDEVWITWNPHHAFGVPVDEAEARAAAEAV